MLPKCGFTICAVLLFICSKVNSSLAVIDVLKPRVTIDPDDWWKHEVIYQIYPRSFKEDGRNLGIGNLKGIEKELDHLKATGITAIWFSQIYDPDDFTKVHSDYGTNDEFKELIKKIHDIHGMRVLVDFDINHSSKNNQWFVQSVARTDPYKDYYVWKDGLPTSGTEPIPPNNWKSVYNDSAWELSKERQQFYLHQFAIDQPDLNYAEEKLRNKMKEVLKGWLDLGVDGIILDTVPFLFEGDISKNEELIPNIDEYKYESLNHSLTKDQLDTFDFIYDLRKDIEEYNKINPSETPKILITAANTDLENAMRYSKGKDKTGQVRSGAHISLNFQLLPYNKATSAEDIVKSINEWLAKANKQTSNWLIGNPDHHRAATRFGSGNVDNMNILIASLPGVMITYNGEEIGQENGEVAYVQCKDPIGCKAGPADFPTVSRDFERTPYQWNNDKNAGFTNDDSKDPWLPVSQGKNKQNLDKQKSDGVTKSHFKTYKYIVQLRKEELFKEGDVEVEALSKNVIKVTRGSKANQYGNYVILINIGKESETVKASNKRGQLYEEQHPNPPSSKIVWAKEVTIPGYTTRIFKVISKEVNYDWWKNAVMYQIYVRSFKDNNNDGVGDLSGIISKLEYLKELGVNVICLSSILDSADKDLGYDVKDFENVAEIYGSNVDLKILTSVADVHGIKVIMDFVPNHSSNQHQKFLETSATRGDYYVISDKPDLTNWLSIYNGKAWSEVLINNEPVDPKEYYLHQFDSTQPDLNYGKELVRKNIETYLKSWLELGVAGFRMTGVPYLFEEGYEDEPLSNNPEAEKGDWNSLRHVYTSNLPKTFNLIYDWRDLLDKYTAAAGGFERIMITEAYTDIHNTMYYYGSKDREGAHLALNFQLIEKVDENSTANDFAEKINEWVHLIPEGFTSNWVLGNHDKHRVATRFGSENVDGFNMLVAILPGVMITYNGEEIGMEDGELPQENCEGDPIFCPNVGEEDPEELEKLRKRRRDQQRTPFHWDVNTFAGFTDGNSPWLPVSKKSRETNLLLQTNQNNSHYELYKRLTKLRRKTAFVNGSLKVKAVTDYVLVSLRYHSANESYFHLFNIGSREETFNLKTAFNEATEFLKVVETNDPERLPAGTLLNANDISLQGHQSVIAELSEDMGPSSATIHVISSFLFVLSAIINTINFY